MVTGSIDAAIKRVDTLNNFPKIMANLGYSADDAKASIDKISKSLIGLPTTLDGMASAVQQLAPLTGSLGEATDLSLALNNALLAGGKSTEIQANAMEQYVQQLAIGKVDMTAWRSMVSAMPGQMDQLSKSLLGANAKQTDLYAAMQSGSVTFDQFNAAILALNKDGYSGFASFAEQAKSATDGIATSQANLATAVTRTLATIIQKLKPAIDAFLSGATQVVNAMGPVLGGIVDIAFAVGDWAAANKDWLVPMAIVVGTLTAYAKAVSFARAVQAAFAAASYGAAGATYAAGFAAKIGAAAYAIQNSSLVTLIASLRANEALSLRTKIAIVASTVATNAATVANKALNLVLRANPIGLIITAITALVGALVWFFTQTELGKAIWAEFTRFLGEAWANISAFFTAAWENVIQPVFKAIGDIAVWLWENVLSPVFDFIGKAVEFIAAAFKLQFDLIVNAFRLVGAIANWLWVNALQPVFTAIGGIVTWLWKNVLEPYINGWAILFQWLWETVLSPVFGFIGDAVNAIGQVFEWLYLNIVKPVWDGISKAIRDAWKWIEANVFKPFGVGIDLIGKAFENTAKAIGKAWDGIKKAAAVPINFVLDTVWNKGLRSFWNDMVGTLGLDDMKLPKAPLVKFASGGVMPGYTPGRDVHQFWSPTAGGLALSGGEAIMRPEFTRLVGGASGVDALNAAARNGKLPFGDGAGNFFGDVWDNITKAASVAWEFMTNPAQAIKSHVIDGIIRPLMGDQNIFGKTVGGLAEKTLMGFVDLFKAAAPKGVGTKGMGWEAMWNIVRSQVPGSVMTSNFRPGAKTVNGGQSYHALGRAIDIVPASMATFNAIAKLFPNASELIYSPAGSRQLQNGRPFNGWSDAVRRQHYNHVHLAMANGGVVPKLYDQGGWLPDGGLAVNRSGKPEAVLTPAESSALRNGLGGMPSELVIVDVHGDLIGRMRIEAEQTLSKAVPSRAAAHVALTT
ncbi:tape measure protein [Microbacterium sp. KKR3/1]|uniref:tape measure protein n=1 Tax=Microbacterium sp. KKR3/1 TaxID=2904241 RepID=UPI001E512057|nr:tape measure protein [Microbacterium sp. KKR3/1]MCE0510842.1 tape measure protein [Microbacterium sp. KKR3/1]